MLISAIYYLLHTTTTETNGSVIIVELIEMWTKLGLYMNDDDDKPECDVNM